jgi:hypothetical protein
MAACGIDKTYKKMRTKKESNLPKTEWGWYG